MIPNLSDNDYVRSSRHDPSEIFEIDTKTSLSCESRFKNKKFY